MSLRRILPLFLVLLIVGCNEGQKPQPAKRPLYERVGGEPVIVKVVDDFVAKYLANPKVQEEHKARFQKGDVAGLKKKLVDTIGQATGGPQKYAGKGIKAAHKGMGIGGTDFDLMLADLGKALDDNKVAPADRDELLGILGKMRPDVVEKKDADERNSQ
jgi:hemoglobin